MNIGLQVAGPPPARVWRFGTAEFDESRQELRVGGRPCPVEAKPLALLQALLLRAGEVAGKAELMEAIWPDVTVVESSLPTAVSKLRQALGPEGRTIIEAVPRVGYRIGVPIELGAARPLARLALSLRAGDAVPGRPDWRLRRALGRGGSRWLAVQAGSGVRHVFSFADQADHLDLLRAEVAAGRRLREALGERDDLLPPLAWNDLLRPYWSESRYGGAGLPEWLRRQGGANGGAEGVSRAARIGIVAQAAAALAAAHGVGVLHGDLRAADVLLQEAADGPQVRLVGFASRREPTTMAADVAALGLLLYRILVDDWDRTLLPGWEADIDDPLLRQDVADATMADPARRLASAALLAERLRTLEARRAALLLRQHEAERAARMAARLERARLRRPWLVLAIASLSLGLVGTGLAGLRAARERDRAVRQERVTAAVNEFLTQDLLGRGNPLKSGVRDETLMEAAVRAEPAIALRLASEPLIAASLYRALALAFDGRDAYGPARDAYARAVAAYEAAEGPASAEAAILRLRWAAMEALSAEGGSIERSRALLASVRPRLAGLGSRAGEARVWLLEADAAADTVENRMLPARGKIESAAVLADSMPDRIDAEARLLLHERLAIAEARLGDWDAADREAAGLQRQADALQGPDHPDMLLIRLMQARSLLVRGRFAEALARFDVLYPKLVATFGPDHRQTLIALMLRAQAEIYLGRYEDGIRDEMAVYRTASGRSGEPGYFATAPLGDAGEALCRSGHAADGLADITRAQALATDTYGANSGLAQFESQNMAFCLVQMKRYGEAAARLDHLDQPRAGSADALPDDAAAIDLMRAEIALAAGDAARARALLTQPRAVFARPGADPYQASWTRRLVAAAGR